MVTKKQARKRAKCNLFFRKLLKAELLLDAHLSVLSEKELPLVVTVKDLGGSGIASELAEAYGGAGWKVRKVDRKAGTCLEFS